MLQLGDRPLQCLRQPGAGAVFPSAEEWAGFPKISDTPLLLTTVIQVVRTGALQIPLNSANDLGWNNAN